MGKAISRPSCASSLIACHLGLDPWLSIIPSGVPDTGILFESKKPPELLDATKVRAATGGDTRCELLKESGLLGPGAAGLGTGPGHRAGPAAPADLRMGPT